MLMGLKSGCGDKGGRVVLALTVALIFLVKRKVEHISEVVIERSDPLFVPQFRKESLVLIANDTVITHELRKVSTTYYCPLHQ